MPTIYIAEDHPAPGNNNGRGPVTDEDHAMAYVTVDSGTNETRVRHELSMHLIKLTSRLDARRARTYIAASNAIADGVDAVQIGTRIYRIRTRTTPDRES